MDEIELLPVVKAYPALSRTYGEVSCIAGVTMAGAPEWIRLYPVPFRALASNQQFAKYQPVRVRATAHSGDRRPETRRPDRDSIEVTGKPIPSDNAWESRKRFVEPLMVESMCEIHRRQKVDKTSLAVFRPAEVSNLIIEAADVKSEKQEIANAWARQGSLLDQVDAGEQAQQIKELELMPWRFKYKYRCSDSDCNGHEQSIIDWEIAEMYRHERKHESWKERIRAKWLDQLCAPDRDTALFVGNQHQHPGSFMVLGVWWPERRPPQLALDVSDV